jgi:hypothetical protein
MKNKDHSGISPSATLKIALMDFLIKFSWKYGALAIIKQLNF